jgi:phosphoribosylamine---glycine ligase
MKRRKILIIGKSGRLDAIASALASSRYRPSLFILSEVNNPGLAEKATVQIGKTDDLATIEEVALQFRPDWAIIGPEEPLAVGAVDKLRELGIPAVGPSQLLAQLESSKAFTRELLRKHEIPGNPEHRVFQTMDGIRDYLETLGSFVVKPDGLTGGKGVQVFGEHLHSITEALAYCGELFASAQPAVIIEERLEGEEFSLQSLYDGKNIVHTIPVQDHKRARDGDTGPNTGGMGSYSCADHSLPFLSRADIREAAEINRRVGEAVSREIGEEYKGVLYGGFMLTKAGVRVIEYNARFGDPEVMNVLPLMEADFIDVCEAIIGGTLDQLSVRFRRQATVCKYIVPESYPEKSKGDQEIRIDALRKLPEYGGRLRVYYGAVREVAGKLLLTGSRAIALVGIGDTLFEAERTAERAASLVEGPVYHRRDIGTNELIQKRLDHIAHVKGEPPRKRRVAG